MTKLNDTNTNQNKEKNQEEIEKLLQEIEDFKTEINEIVQGIRNLERNRVRLRSANYLWRAANPEQQDLN